MLIAARDRFGVETDVEKRLLEDGNEETVDSHIAALFGDLIFHNGGQIENDGLELEDLHVEFGDGPQEKVDEETEVEINEAWKAGLSPLGIK